MDPVYVIQSLDGLYFTKQKEWNNGQDAAAVLGTPHYDLALNTLIEINAKDYHLRAKVVEVAIDERKRPILEISAAPPPLTEQVDAQLAPAAGHEA
ncbi:MAG: hypothetical protein V7711_05280 [Pseudomonadales bacterium]